MTAEHRQSTSLFSTISNLCYCKVGLMGFLLAGMFLASLLEVVQFAWTNKPNILQTTIFVHVLGFLACLCLILQKQYHTSLWIRTISGLVAAFSSCLGRTANPDGSTVLAVHIYATFMTTLGVAAMMGTSFYEMSTRSQSSPVEGPMTETYSLLLLLPGILDLVGHGTFLETVHESLQVSKSIYIIGMVTALVQSWDGLMLALYSSNQLPIHLFQKSVMVNAHMVYPTLISFFLQRLWGMQAAVGALMLVWLFHHAGAGSKHPKEIHEAYFLYAVLGGVGLYWIQSYL